MRVMLMVKATGYSETGVGHSRDYTEALEEYRRLLAKEGVLLAEEELQPSSRGIRIMYSQAGKPQLWAGPFVGESKDLIAGFYILDVQTEEEAVQWALGMPIPTDQGEYELELRRLEEDAAFIRQPVIEGMKTDLQEQLSIFQNLHIGSGRI